MNSYCIKLRSEDCSYLLHYIEKHNITDRGRKISVGMAIVSIVENFCYEQKRLEEGTDVEVDSNVN
jgi:hypothetical protein